MKLRPNYFVFIGCLKTGDGDGVRVNPLNPSGSTTVRSSKTNGRKKSNRKKILHFRIYKLYVTALKVIEFIEVY